MSNECEPVLPPEQTPLPPPPEGAPPIPEPTPQPK